MKVLRAKKYAKTKKHQRETTEEKNPTSLEKKDAEESDKNQNLVWNLYSSVINVFSLRIKLYWKVIIYQLMSVFFFNRKRMMRSNVQC